MAVPEAMVPVPSVVEPSRKVTVPVGPEEGVMVAVKVMLAPVAMVEDDAVSAVVVEVRVGGVVTAP